jgi:putative ABC transport system permease protein
LNLSREFVVLIGISFFIGSGITVFYIHGWMSQFTYHTSISIWVFLVTLVASMGICLLTVSWQAIRAALANPVKSLRSE